jgi:2-aminoadipate transaminase
MQFDFGTGNTNPESFPTEEFADAAQRAIRNSVVELNSYGGPVGHAGLRRLLAQREMDREGVEVDPDSLLVTNGSMQGVTLVAEVLCPTRGDRVVMESYNYLGTIRAYHALELECLGVPLDAQGMKMDALEDVLKQACDEERPPGFIYTLATYQNPTGSLMPRERRLQLLDIAERYDQVVVEDNCYGDVHYEGEKEPSLYALDDSERMIYLCSLSKIFAPGIRLGYIMARGKLHERLQARRCDAGPNTLASAIICEYFGEDGLWPHVERANAALKIKRDAMLSSLEESLGNLCTWSHPVGGLFIWITLPEEIDLDRFEELAAERDRVLLGLLALCNQ